VTKVELLLPEPTLPSVQREIDEKFIGHRLWEAKDKDGFIRFVSDRVRGIAPEDVTLTMVVVENNNHWLRAASSSASVRGNGHEAPRGRRPQDASAQPARRVALRALTSSNARGVSSHGEGRRALNAVPIVCKFRPHRLDDKVYEGLGSVQIEFSIRIGVDLGLQALIVRPFCELLQVGARRFAEE
jgi:hypothetical protein